MKTHNSKFETKLVGLYLKEDCDPVSLTERYKKTIWGQLLVTADHKRFNQDETHHAPSCACMKIPLSISLDSPILDYKVRPLPKWTKKPIALRIT